MPPVKTLLLLFLLIGLSSRELYAQQPISNSLQVSDKRSVDPSNAAALNSLQQLTDYHSMTNRAAVLSQQLNNVILQGSNSSNRSFKQMRVTQSLSMNRPIHLNERTNTICYTISGRDFLMQDSLIFWSGDPAFTADGNIIISGEFAGYSILPSTLGGFCMKTDIQGNVIWAKVFDSTAETSWDYVNYFKPIELHDGSILLAGRTTNKISGNDDFIITKLDNNGNIIWTKTYASRFWQGFNGSGDFFSLRDLEEDPVTGEVYFAGNHFFGLTTITKIDPADGHIIWSNSYDPWGSDFPFGIIIHPDKLLLFQLEFGSSNESYIDATAISKTNGDTLYTKQCSQTGDLYSARLYNTFSVTELNNGHFRMSGPTTHYWEFPAYTGTVDLYHAGIIELDENFNFVKAWGYKNRLESNGYNTKISLYPDGSGVFTMLDYISGFTAESQVCLFRDELIYHQRKRLNYNEGMPYEPFTQQLSDGGFLNVKVMGDSTAVNSSRIDYYRIHTSDTASACLGIKDSANSIWYLNFEPINRGMDSVRHNIFSVSRVKTYDTWNFSTHTIPSCTITSNCDTLYMTASATTVCPGSNVVVTVHKNKECGSLVPLAYDTNFVNQVTGINDSTYIFHFNQPGSSYIYGSLMGCVLRKDSVHIEVLPARNYLDLGLDTVICPDNHIIINAGSGFASYIWQDGSTDTSFTVSTPGIYYLTAMNSCGTTYTDTVQVNSHPPIPISIGPDRFKCNNDTIRLTAPPGFINYTWSSDYNISSLTGQQVIVNPLVDTMYILAAEKTPGCFAYDSIYITVKTSPPINLGGDTSICRNDTLILDAGVGFQTYTWNTGAIQQQLTINQPGSYSIKATTADGCSSYDTLKLLSLYNLPQPDLGPDSIVCVGQSRILHTPGQFSTYLWNNGAATSTIAVNVPGQYWLSVTDAHGCNGADTTLIPSLENTPAGFLGIDTAICSYSNIVLQPSGSFGKYLWSTGSAGASIKITQPGNYWLEVTDNNYCKGRDSIVVTLKQCMEGLYIPSAFTPNGDGLNDLLIPMLFGEIKSLRFQIFNRWGEVVFETTAPGKGWDGNYKGQKQDSNVFIWTCTYQLNGKKVEYSNGKIVLIR